MPVSSYTGKQADIRDISPGAQLGDKRKTPLPKFDPNLNLPKGVYPEKHQEHTVSKNFKIISKSSHFFF